MNIVSFSAPLTPLVLEKVHYQMRSAEKRKKPLGRIRREEFFVPILVVLFSISYITQVWGAPRVVILWPYIVMVTLLVCTAAVVVEGLATSSWRQERSKDTSGAGLLAWLGRGFKPLVITGTTIIYLGAIERLGFTLSNFLYLMILFRALGTRRFWVITVISLVIIIILHLVMINFLQMPVPRLSLPFISWEL